MSLAYDLNLRFNNHRHNSKAGRFAVHIEARAYRHAGSQLATHVIDNQTAVCLICSSCIHHNANTLTCSIYAKAVHLASLVNHFKITGCSASKNC